MKRRMRTTGQIAKLFFDADSGTMVRKPNMRRFAKDNGIFNHILFNGRWIIDVDEFIAKVNPKQRTFYRDMPRLRNIDTSVTLFNKTYPSYNIDRHTIEKCLLSDSVFKIKHGNRWIINYDELEQEILLQFSKPNEQ